MILGSNAKRCSSQLYYMYMAGPNMDQQEADFVITSLLDNYY